MLKIKEAIIVEGRYDKIRLQALVDTVIIETGGFRLFKSKEKLNLIKKLADARGIIVFTDSDSGGLVIRNHLNSSVPKGKLKHAYIPEIKGKEKRKDKPSKQGFLGVEGVNDEILINAIIRCGATVLGENSLQVNHTEISKTDLYDLGLIGKENSKALRERLLSYLDFPSYLSTKALLSAINILYTKDEFTNLVASFLP